MNPKITRMLIASFAFIFFLALALSMMRYNGLQSIFFMAGLTYLAAGIVILSTERERYGALSPILMIAAGGIAEFAFTNGPHAILLMAIASSIFASSLFFPKNVSSGR